MNAMRYQGWWIAAALVVGNCLMYIHLAKKINVLQESLAALDVRLVRAGETQADARNGIGVAKSSSASLSGSSQSSAPTALAFPGPAGVDAMDAINRIRDFKQRKSSINPVTLAADLNNRMTGEPALPAIEKEHSNWLDSTLQQMPADAPHAGGLQTTCNGRRCLVSAAFSSEDDARAWGTRYLLEGGGKLLQHSSIVIVPLSGGDAAETRLLRELLSEAG